MGTEISDTVVNNFRVQIFEVHLCSVERFANRTLRNYLLLVKLWISAISLVNFCQLPNKNYEFVFQISGRKGCKDITIIFWRGKATVLTNIRELARLSASANWWDTKHASGNLTSINVLTVQQISPYHKLCVYIILSQSRSVSRAVRTCSTVAPGIQSLRLLYAARLSVVTRSLYPVTLFV